MKVLIHGPNLIDQTKGTFHVHAVDCQDNRHYGPGKKFGGEVDNMPVETGDRIGVVEYVYADQLDENPDAEAVDWLDDFHFAPCVKGLPEAKEHKHTHTVRDGKTVCVYCGEELEL